MANNETRYIPLHPITRGAIAKVDAADYATLRPFRWSLGTWGYAERHARADGVGRTIGMHRDVMQPPAGYEVDHINGDKLDNRRSNLRICTRAQNAANRVRASHNNASMFKGVGRLRSGNWRARITVNGQLRNLGTFDTEIEAAIAYDRAAVQEFGEFARLNVPRLTTKSA
jgi:hypothetical protein